MLRARPERRRHRPRHHLRIVAERWRGDETLPCHHPMRMRELDPMRKSNGLVLAILVAGTALWANAGCVRSRPGDSEPAGSIGPSTPEPVGSAPVAVALD